MNIYARAVLLGLLSWLVPLLASFGLYPLKGSNAALFSSAMFLVVLATAGVLLAFYFLHRELRIAEAVWVGLLWLGMNLVLDFPMFAFGPMKMTAMAYYSEIGLVYLTFPLFAVLAGTLAKHREG